MKKILTIPLAVFCWLFLYMPLLVVAGACEGFREAVDDMRSFFE